MTALHATVGTPFGGCDASHGSALITAGGEWQGWDAPSISQLHFACAFAVASRLLSGSASFSP